MTPLPCPPPLHFFHVLVALTLRFKEEPFTTAVIALGFKNLCGESGVWKLVCGESGAWKLACGESGAWKLVCGESGAWKLVCGESGAWKLVCGERCSWKLVSHCDWSDTVLYILLLELY